MRTTKLSPGYEIVAERQPAQRWAVGIDGEPLRAARSEERARDAVEVATRLAALLERSSFSSGGDMAEGGKVIWFEIYVANIERAKGFYGGMFGWSFTPLSDYDPENYWLIQGSDEGTVAGALVQMPGRPTPSEWSVVLYVNVNHLEDAVESATRLGGKLIQSRTLISETAGSFAIVRDTEGNHLGLWVE